MRYEVKLRPAAAKVVESLDKPVRRRVLARLEELRDDPRPPQCQKLKGKENEWRIKAGDYRIIYEIHDSVLLVKVIQVGHRREVYR